MPLPQTQIWTNSQILFHNPPEKCTQYSWSYWPKKTTDIHSHPTRGLGKKASKHTNKQPSISDIFAQNQFISPEQKSRHRSPKVVLPLPVEGYDHWRKDCPYDCHCDNCDSDSHTTHMCRGTPKNPSPTPSPQPVICIYCGSSDHRSMECSNHPRDNREEGRAPSPAPKLVQSRENNGNLL